MFASWDPRWSSAISGIESGGDYGQITDAGKGRKAVGKYQVMDFNVAPWTQSALGRAMTPDEFASDPDAQEAVFKNQFGNYVQKYGSPQEAASVWFSGRPMAQAGNASDRFGTTVPSYVAKFNKAMGEPGVQAINKAAPQTAQSGDSMTPTPPPDDGFMGSLLSRINGQSNGSQGTYDLGDALGNAGASMMALDNAKGAAVLASMTQANRKAAAGPKMTEWSLEPSTGTFYRTNPRTGQLETQAGPAKPVVDKPIPESALKNVGENMDKYDYLAQSSQNAADIIDDLKSGKLDLGMFKNWMNSGKNMAGMSDDQSRAFARYNQYLQGLVNDNLRLNKGVQTEGDAYRELKAISSNGSSYDNQTATEALQRVIKKSKEAVLNRGTGYLDSHTANYGEEPFVPYREMSKGWKGAFDDIDKRLGASPTAGSASSAAPASASAAPAPQWKVLGVRPPK